MSKFKLYYDDGPDDVVDKISTALEEFDLEIVMMDGDDGSVEYEIIKIE